MEICFNKSIYSDAKDHIFGLKIQTCSVCLKNTQRKREVSRQLPTFVIVIEVIPAKDLLFWNLPIQNICENVKVCLFQSEVVLLLNQRQIESCEN